MPTPYAATTVTSYRPSSMPSIVAEQLVAQPVESATTSVQTIAVCPADSIASDMCERLTSFCAASRFKPSLPSPTSRRLLGCSPSRTGTRRDEAERECFARGGGGGRGGDGSRRVHTRKSDAELAYAIQKRTRNEKSGASVAASTARLHPPWLTPNWGGRWQQRRSSTTEFSLSGGGGNGAGGGGAGGGCFDGHGTTFG